jgi:hypothetical protein
MRILVSAYTDVDDFGDTFATWLIVAFLPKGRAPFSAALSPGKIRNLNCEIAAASIPGPAAPRR